MKKKQDRIKKIRSFLRLQSYPSTATEVHNALTKRMHISVSRKTVERDLTELVEEGVVSAASEIPAKYVLAQPSEVTMTLTIEEIERILELLDKESELYLKLSTNL